MHSGVTVRVVCKAWLRISNSLTPFFINRINAMQIALIKQAVMRKPTLKETYEQTWDEFVAMRLKKHLNTKLLVPLLIKFGIPPCSFDRTDADGMAEALAGRLCCYSDDEDCPYSDYEED